MIATQGRDILKFTMGQATLSSLLKEDINVAEELGTKDVIEQVDTRLGTLEQDVGSLDSKVDARFERVHEEIGGLRSEMNSTTRWLVGIIFASWLTMMASMASIWLKLGN
tara:strand:+ start:505 stop:834 length:330 start_codon:yes stop_codon:yes gene_type:complete